MEPPNDSVMRARGRSFHSKPKGAGSFVSKLRSRSASVSGVNKLRVQPQQQQQVNAETTPSAADSSEEHKISSQIKDVVERHQLALRTEMLELMETREKEARFWKNKALKLRKRVSLLDESEVMSSSTLSHEGGSEQMIMEKKKSILERQMQDRDAQIELLKGVAEKQEKANEERERMVECQIERLVEIQGKVRKGSFKADAEHDIHPNHEVSTLEQLIMRVLKEKDKLAYENDNMRSRVRDTASPASVPNDTMYQLSCRLCDGQQFMGNTSGELKKVVKEHFSTVWHLVQPTPGMVRKRDSEFRTSSLAHHIASHCKQMDSEEDVRKWCKKNVKLGKMGHGISLR